MVQIKAATADEYIEKLPAEKRETIVTLRKLINKNLPKGYVESVSWGVISYEIPLSVFPDTYNKQPLTYVALAAQKNHYALYLMCAYANSKHSQWLAAEFKKAGKKLDMGKSCLRFKKLDDLPLNVIEEAIGMVTPEKYLAFYKAARANPDPNACEPAKAKSKNPKPKAKGKK
jgi:ribosomal protein S7